MNLQSERGLVQMGEEEGGVKTGIGGMENPHGYPDRSEGAELIGILL